MAQVYLDEDEYEAVVTFFCDNFPETDLTMGRKYADDLLNELDFGKMESVEEKES